MSKFRSKFKKFVSLHSSVVSRQLSVISSQPSVFTHQSSIFDRNVTGDPREIVCDRGGPGNSDSRLIGYPSDARGGRCALRL